MQQGTTKSTLSSNENIVSLDTLMNPLKRKVDLSHPHQLKICFPILLDGDLVMSSEHLGPAYLVSVLRNAKALCRIVEIPVESNFEDLIDDIINWEPDIIAISLTTISVAFATKFGKYLKEKIKNSTFILVGGPLATFKGAQLLTMEGWEFVDGLIRGEGEIPILRFAEDFHSNKGLSNVPSLVYRDNDTIIETEIAAGINNLDWLPEPARDQFEFHNEKLAYLRVSTSRGCTSYCTFCNAPHAKNRIGPAVKGWRGASPKRIVDEVQYLYEKYNFNTFDFVDSTFEDPGGKKKAKARIANIAQGFMDRGLKIYYNVCMQAYNWHAEDKPLINLLWKSGLEKVLVGIESGSEVGLRRWKKRSTVEDNERIIKLLGDANIYVAFGFISFHPWSTFEEIYDNYHFLRYNMGHNLRRFTVRLELYPGAEVVDQLRAENMLKPAYDTHLNPFAYTYVDPRVEDLASALNGLYGKEYEENCTITTSPAVFDFETYDIVLHTYISRLKRLFDGKSVATEVLNDAEENIKRVKNQLAEFNYKLIMKYVDMAEKGILNKREVWAAAPTIEDFYQAKIKELKGLQLRTSLKLYRNGFNVSSIKA